MAIASRAMPATVMFMCNRDGQKVSELQLLVCQGKGETQGGGQVIGCVQTEDQAADPALGQTQHGGSDRATKTISAELVQTPDAWLSLDEWLRHRLRVTQLNQWKRGSTICQEFINTACQSR